MIWRTLHLFLTISQTDVSSGTTWEYNIHIITCVKVRIAMENISLYYSEKQKDSKSQIADLCYNLDLLKQNMYQQCPRTIQ